jgi:hypothetical protein
LKIQGYYAYILVDEQPVGDVNIHKSRLRKNDKIQSEFASLKYINCKLDFITHLFGFTHN